MTSCLKRSNHQTFQRSNQKQQRRENWHIFSIFENNQISAYMNWRTLTFLAAAFLHFNLSTAQENEHPKPSIDWVFFLDGYNTTDLSDLIVDDEGNTYFSANYSMAMRIPELKLDLPYSNHVIGALIKLNKQGKAQWAIPFESDFDNRIKDIAFAPNGDILLTGHTDGVTKFPGKEVLPLGKEKSRFRYHRYQFAWIARYTQDGERVWAKLLEAPWAEGTSVAVDQNDNIYWSMYHIGTLRDGEEILDSFPPKNTISRTHLYKMSSDGEILGRLPLKYHTESTNTFNAPKLRIDNDNNLVAFGLFKGRIDFTEEDSFTNDSYYDGRDAYLMKYSPKGEYLWGRQIGGQSSEMINDLEIDPKNRLHLVGSFSYECVINSGIKTVQRSKFKYKSGNSFFSARFTEDGVLDFAKFKTPDGYSTSCVGHTLALDQAGYAHVLGSFTDTITFGYGLKPVGHYRHNSTTYSSVWKKDIPVALSKDIEAQAWNYTHAAEINGDHFVRGGYYYGEGYFKLTNGKKVKLSQYEHGRASYVYGGTVPKLPPIEDEVNSDSSEEILAFKSMPKCYSPLVEQEADVWFPYEIKDSAKLVVTEDIISNLDCGVKIKKREAKLFPNPTRGISTLELSGLKGQVHIEILSQKGDLLLAQQIEIRNDQHMMDFDLSGAAEGLYYVTVAQNGYKKVLRLVRVR